MSVIWINSVFAPPPEPVRVAEAEGWAEVVPQPRLTADSLRGVRGLVTGNPLDQDAMLQLTPALERFLDRGGRWFFNGHFVRPLLAGLERYRPMPQPRRRDFELHALAPHPVFQGIDMKRLEVNRGVAGFYGRGCNPPPAGAVTINGLGPDRVPVDWVWPRPGGGGVFSHSGNDLGTAGQEWGLAPVLQRRILEWASGAACLA